MKTIDLKVPNAITVSFGTGSERVVDPALVTAISTEDGHPVLYAVGEHFGTWIRLFPSPGDVVRWSTARPSAVHRAIAERVGMEEPWC